MARMAGSIGPILAVRLLGCTSICQMAPESRTVGLNWTYRMKRSDRGQTGHREPRAPGSRDHLARSVASRQDLRKELRGTGVLEAIVADVKVAVTIALFPGGVMTRVIMVVALAVRRERSLVHPGQGCAQPRRRAAA